MFSLNKIQLRERALIYLKSLSTDGKKMIENKLIKRVINLDCWKTSNIIGLTVSQPFEWDTQKMINSAWEQGKKVALPKCSPYSKVLDFYIVDSFDQLENVYVDLLEPKKAVTQKVLKKDIDLIVVPGLLFDLQGYRIGFGGGYYDRYLCDYPNQSISICSTEQIVADIQAEAFDIPVDCLITEKEVINMI